MCMRCHASSDAELIFSDLDNVEGFPREPLIFRVDESWRNMTDQPPGPFKPDKMAATCARPDRTTTDHRFLPQQRKAGSAERRRERLSDYGERGVYRSIPAKGRNRHPVFETATPAQRMAGPCAVASGRAAAVPDLGQLRGLSWRTGRAALGHGDVPADRTELWRRPQHLGIRRVALVTDGTGRARSDLLCATRVRVCTARSRGRRRRDGGAGNDLPVVPRCDGSATA